MMDGDGWMWGHGWGWGGWLLMCMVVLLLWAALITSLVLAIRYLGASNRPPERGAAIAPPSPEDTLAQRYAHGEIDDEEYRRRIALLREHQV